MTDTAVPDWTFWKFPQYPAALPGIDEAAAIIRGGAAGHPWAERVPKLFFMGEAHGGQRRPAWELLKTHPGRSVVSLCNACANH